jgi:hypothetical protein
MRRSELEPIDFKGLRTQSAIKYSEGAAFGADVLLGRGPLCRLSIVSLDRIDRSSLNRR